MKLIRIGPDGREKPGLLLNDGRRIDASPVTDDYNEHFFEQGGLAKLQAWINTDTLKQELDSNAWMGPPIARPSKIVCVGLNYALHAKESGMKPPPEPVMFLGSSIILVKQLVFGLHLDRGQGLRDGSKSPWRGVFYFGSRGYRL